MRAVPPVATGPAGTRCTCTACPLLCDDIWLTPAGAERACELGRTVFAAAMAAPPGGDAATASPAPIDQPRPGGPGAEDSAVTRAASLLTAARRVLVTGMLDATLEAILAACDLAEELAAAVDAGQPELAAPAGPTAARVGGVTADWEELRDRADLVIFWNCDANTTHPRFVERFVLPPLADGRLRQTATVGPTTVMPAVPQHRHLPLAAGQSVEAARWLHAVLDGGRLDDSVEESLAAAASAVAEAIRAASCVAFVTADGGGLGLDSWSVARLVRSIAHRMPAFEVPLGGPAGAAAICTWRYGASGGITRADRSGGACLPGEACAARLVQRGEVDAVLAVGRLSSDVEDALAAAGPRLAVVRIAARPSARTGATDRSIDLRCADPLLTAGTMLRGDGRRVVVAPPHEPPCPPQRDVITALHAAVARARRIPDGGGR